MADDSTHRLFLVYPEGNWVEIGPDTPYQIIGASGFGKPILERSLTRKDSMLYAFKVGLLAFDATRLCAADVDFPMDVILYSNGSLTLVEQRYEREDLREISLWWQDRMRRASMICPRSGWKRRFRGSRATKSCSDAHLALCIPPSTATIARLSGAAHVSPAPPRRRHAAPPAVLHRILPDTGGADPEYSTRMAAWRTKRGFDTPSDNSRCGLRFRWRRCARIPSITCSPRPLSSPFPVRRASARRAGPVPGDRGMPLGQQP